MFSIPKFNDLTGQLFGRLKVLHRSNDKIRPSGKRVVVWCCSCECGNKCEVEAYSLTSSKTLSCGCYGKEVRKKANTKHNLSHTRIKKTYYNMLSRCNNPNSSKYEIYGGRGIKVCDEWSDKEKGLINFHKWAMENGYSDTLTIDRIDGNGDYCPNNCKWSTYTEQNYNRSVTRKFKVNDRYFSAKEICQRYSININTFWGKIHKGFDVDEILKNKLKISKGNVNDEF